MFLKVVDVREGPRRRPRRRQRRVGIEPRRVRRRRAPVAGLDASREEHAVAAVFAGPPQLKSGRGRRVCSAQVPNGYSDFGLCGRGRQIGLASREQTCRRARRACATAGEAPLTYVRQRTPSDHVGCFEGSFRFQRKRHEHAPRLREGTRRTPQRTQQPAQGPGPARRPAAAAARGGPATRRFDGNAPTTPPGRPRARPNPKTTGAVTRAGVSPNISSFRPPAVAALNFPYRAPAASLFLGCPRRRNGLAPNPRAPHHARGAFWGAA